MGVQARVRAGVWASRPPLLSGGRGEVGTGVGVTWLGPQGAQWLVEALRPRQGVWLPEAAGREDRAAGGQLSVTRVAPWNMVPAATRASR